MSARQGNRLRVDQLNARLRDLIARVRNADAGSLNAGIHAVVRPDDPGTPLPYADDLVTAMTLVPVGTWFNWSHFGFSLVPNVAVPGIPMSTAVDYYPEDSLNEGAPVAFEAMAHDSHDTRKLLSRLVCEAALMAMRVPVLKKLATRNERHYVVQTGRGPMLAVPGSPKLACLPPRTYLTKDGRLVPHDEGVHGFGYVEEPDA